MNHIKETLHKKRKITEEHIKQLQQKGNEGVRYTAMMPDIPFLILGLICDIGWIIHIISSVIYFYYYHFSLFLDWLSLIALIGVVFGVGYTIYMNKIHEKEIATKIQKNLSFGLTVYAGLIAGIIGIFQVMECSVIPLSLTFMTIGGFVNFIAGIPIYLSFKKGIVYGVQ